MVNHPKRDQMLAAAGMRLLRHMHSFDPTLQASAAMSQAKADGRFKEQLEELFRQIITDYSPVADVARAVAALEAQGFGAGREDPL